MWTFAWQNLITRPTRTALAVLGLTIPLLAFFGLFSLSGGIRHLMGDTLATMQNLMVIKDTAPAPVLSDLPPNTGDELRKIPGVRVVAAEVWKIAPTIDGRASPGMGAAALGMLSKSHEQGISSFLNLTTIEGIDIRAHRQLKHMAFVAGLLPKSEGGGRMLDESDLGKPHVAISTKIAEKYANADRSPKKVGQTLRIGNKDFTIIGLYNTSTPLLDATIVMDIDVARELLKLNADAVSTFNVEPENFADADTLIERIENAITGVRAQRISQFSMTVGSVMGRLNLFLLLAVALAVLVGGVGIANTMLMSTSERYVEFGVMRTNGWTRRNVLVLVTTESALLGLLSGLLGAALATAAVASINRFLKGFALDLSAELVAASLAAALAIAVLSGLYPAWKASRMTPMDAIRHTVA
jgi:putative ABC transport system permease protein